MTDRDVSELHQTLTLRALLIERARDNLRNNLVPEAVTDMLEVLSHIQGSDERILRLHMECIALVECARKVLELAALHRPALPSRIEKG